MAGDGSRGAAVEKSYAFALRIVKLSRHLKETRKEFVLSRQALRSGTSIGANMEEAVGAQTEREFLSKVCIAYKEARETHYWLRLLRDSKLLSEKSADSVIKDCEELLKIIGSIRKTMLAKLKP